MMDLRSSLVGTRPVRAIDAHDLLDAAILIGLTPAAWLLPEGAWPRLARLLASLHLAARGSGAADLAGHPALDATGFSLAGLERSALAGMYEETLQMLREHRPGGWAGSIRLRGGEHVEAALAKGRGVVLWTASCTYGELIVKKALHAAGHPIMNLRTHVHPYSGTRFGQAILNRVRTSIEDRFLFGSAWLYPGSPTAALGELRARLRQNGVVSIAAIGAGDNPCRLPCLGGTLKLALGGPMLALLAKAPLLPVFAAPEQRGGYEVEIQGALEPAGCGSREERLAAAFVPRLEAFVARHPTVWRGWFSRVQWEPAPVEHPVSV